jgi:hypothetical protein
VAKMYMALGKKGSKKVKLKKSGLEIEKPVKGLRYAAPSIPKLKAMIAEWPDSVWDVATFKVRFNLVTVIQLINDPTQIEAEETRKMQVTSTGKCREV